MRRRGWGRRRGGNDHGGDAGAGRLLERLRDARGLGLREIAALPRGEGEPEQVALASARWEGNRPVAIAAARRESLELLGWARVAAHRAGHGRGLHEVFIAAPLFSERTRRAAARAGELGQVVHLLTLPSLSDSGEAFEIESHPLRPEPGLVGGGATLLARVLRVLEGAAAVTSAGGVRPAGSEYLVFVRGERVARIQGEAEGVAVSLLLPEHRQIHVTESNFPRWGVELHEWLVTLAQDPRLLEGEAAQRDLEIERAAEDARAGVTARWLPWNREGREVVDWVGVDIDGRPVVGLIRDAVTVADVPGIVAGWHLVDLERAAWTPGASGLPRLSISAGSIEPEARDILEALTGSIHLGRSEAREAEAGEERTDELGSAPEHEAGAFEPRSGRRRRRRRRGRGSGRFDERGADERPRAEEFEAGVAEDRPAEAEPELEPEELSAGPGPEDLPREELEAPGADDDWSEEARDAEAEPDGGELAAEREPAGDDAQPESGRSRRRGRRGRRRRGRRGFRVEDGRERGSDVAGEAAPAGEDEGELDAVDQAAELEGSAGAGEDLPRAPGDEELVEHEVEATLAEGEEERERAAPSEPEAPPPRARRARAAIVVRDEPESILAALVLARDRRTIVSFRTLRQESLMDFFRGPATDIPENVDVLVVGFTAQPRPKEVLDSAELFRGRLQWFDHHEWAIEDVERLRAALGRDSILIANDAASPLAAVTQVTERRSRFTDKLVDLSARRLSEGDMQKWGYRVIQLIQRMAQSPGEHRAEIISVLAGKPTDLPSAADVYRAETDWVEEHDPRIVHFGEYQLAVCQVPRHLDAGEVGRRVRLRTGARLSLAAREGDDLVMLSCNDEKRPLNVVNLLDAVGNELPFVRPKVGGDRIGRARVEELDRRPERIEELIGGIVRHRSMLYG
ncbi:MAG TPA: hypothetical protein VEN47_04505 [Myxococcota bacterium]|nr:hypothetical protein [Myxococcota bacterium]